MKCSFCLVREGGAGLGATLAVSSPGQPFPLPSALHTNTASEPGEETWEGGCVSVLGEP